MTAWTILVKGHQRNISAKLFWNWSSGFWQEIFFSCFLYRHIGKISPAPWRPCDGLNILVTKDSFLPIYIEISPVVSDEKIFKVFYTYIYIGKINPTILKLVQQSLTIRFLKLFFSLPWQPKSCMDSKSMNNFHSVSPKNQSCEIWLELAQWFRSSCLTKLWTDTWTSRRWLMVSDHNNSLWASGSGELKKY